VQEVEIKCALDLTKPGKMSDILSNALNRGLDAHSPDVRSFLDMEAPNYETGKDLLKATAVKFGVEESVLVEQVEKYRHCNCTHAPLVTGQITSRDDHDSSLWDDVTGTVEATQFAKDVTLHVVLHELGHALIREFDIPVLANEETMADAFATYYLTTHLPDRAVDVIAARTASLMIEASEVPRAEWSVSGEHDSDARRAFQIAALAVAADSDKYRAVAKAVGLTEREMANGADYGSEIQRSWRRVLRPLWMPEGQKSTEARIKYESDNEFLRTLCEGGFADELESILKRFDWHSQVTINFVHGGGGASWSRSKRTVTVKSEYVLRFVFQGESAKE
jgi:hypothetical protein